MTLPFRALGVVLVFTSCGSGFSSTSGSEFEVRSAIWVPEKSTLILSDSADACALERQRARASNQLTFFVRSGVGVHSVSSDVAARQGRGGQVDVAGSLREGSETWDTTSGQLWVDRLDGAGAAGHFAVKFSKVDNGFVFPATAFELTGAFDAERCALSTTPSGTGGGGGSSSNMPGSFSCQVTVASMTQSCTDYAWVGSGFSSAELTQSCQAGLGVVGSGCSHSGSFGGCKMTTKSGAVEVTTTSWFYASTYAGLTASQQHDALVRGCPTGVVVSP